MTTTARSPGSTIGGMSDDDATLAAPIDGPLPTTEPAPTVVPNEPLAYSEPTGSMPLIDYQSPPRAWMWWRAVALVAAILAVTGGAAAAILLLGQHPAATPPAPEVVSAAPTVTPPPPPTVTVTTAPPPPSLPPPPTSTVPPGPDTWTATDIAAESRLSPMDKRFILLLPAEPFNHHDPISLTMSANAACRMLYQGSTREKVLSYVASPETDVGRDAGVAFLNAAVMVYCPNAG